MKFSLKILLVTFLVLCGDLVYARLLKVFDPIGFQQRQSDELPHHPKQSGFDENLQVAIVDELPELLTTPIQYEKTQPNFLQTIIAQPIDVKAPIHKKVQSRSTKQQPTTKTTYRFKAFKSPLRTKTSTDYANKNVAPIRQLQELPQLSDIFPEDLLGEEIPLNEQENSSPVNKRRQNFHRKQKAVAPKSAKLTSVKDSIAPKSEQSESKQEISAPLPQPKTLNCTSSPKPVAPATEKQSCNIINEVLNSPEPTQLFELVEELNRETINVGTENQLDVPNHDSSVTPVPQTENTTNQPVVNNAEPDPVSTNCIPMPPPLPPQNDNSTTPHIQRSLPGDLLSELRRGIHLNDASRRDDLLSDIASHDRTPITGEEIERRLAERRQAREQERLEQRLRTVNSDNESGPAPDIRPLPVDVMSNEYKAVRERMRLRREERLTREREQEENRRLGIISEEVSVLEHPILSEISSARVRALTETQQRASRQLNEFQRRREAIINAYRLRLSSEDSVPEIAEQHPEPSFSEQPIVGEQVVSRSNPVAEEQVQVENNLPKPEVIDPTPEELRRTELLMQFSVLKGAVDDAREKLKKLILADKFEDCTVQLKSMFRLLENSCDRNILVEKLFDQFEANDFAAYLVLIENLDEANRFKSKAMEFLYPEFTMQADIIFSNDFDQFLRVRESLEHVYTKTRNYNRDNIAQDCLRIRHQVENHSDSNIAASASNALRQIDDSLVLTLKNGERVLAKEMMVRLWSHIKPYSGKQNERATEFIRDSFIRNLASAGDTPLAIASNLLKALQGHFDGFVLHDHNPKKGKLTNINLFFIDAVRNICNNEPDFKEFMLTLNGTGLSSRDYHDAIMSLKNRFEERFKESSKLPVYRRLLAAKTDALRQRYEETTRPTAADNQSGGLLAAIQRGVNLKPATVNANRAPKLSFMEQQLLARRVAMKEDDDDVWSDSEEELEDSDDDFLYSSEGNDSLFSDDESDDEFDIRSPVRSEPKFTPQRSEKSVTIIYRAPNNAPPPPPISIIPATPRSTAKGVSLLDQIHTGTQLKQSDINADKVVSSPKNNIIHALSSAFVGMNIPSADGDVDDEGWSDDDDW
jgi:hypothetical protein